MFLRFDRIVWSSSIEGTSNGCLLFTFFDSFLIILILLSDFLNIGRGGGGGIGFFTDIIGFLLLIPFTRKVIFALTLKAGAKKKRNNDKTIDGEIIEKKDEL